MYNTGGIEKLKKFNDYALKVHSRLILRFCFCFLNSKEEIINK